MRLAYADPPYLGQSKKHYGREEVDHAALAKQLRDYDGWALSCSSPSLATLLPLFPGRVGAWVKPFAVFKPGVNPAFAWEPVIFKPARKRERTEPTVRDWVSANITLRKGLVGAKPAAFCDWLFDLLQAEPTDTFDDLFPGTGIVSLRWEMFSCRALSAPAQEETP